MLIGWMVAPTGVCVDGTTGVAAGGGAAAAGGVETETGVGAGAGAVGTAGAVEGLTVTMIVIRFAGDPARTTMSARPARRALTAPSGLTVTTVESELLKKTGTRSVEIGRLN